MENAANNNSRRSPERLPVVPVLMKLTQTNQGVLKWKTTENMTQYSTQNQYTSLVMKIVIIGHQPVKMVNNVEVALKKI